PDGTRALATAQAGLAQGWNGVSQADATRWQTWLGRARMPQGLSSDALAVYRRALITLGQHHVDNGGFIAAPTNLNPPYRFVWPRDGSLMALTLMNVGYVSEAKAFFEFCEHLQQASGGFAVNYFPDASRPLWDFGPNGNEHDEVGTFAWGVAQVYARTGDRQWLEARWPAVKRACEFLIAQQKPDGLLSTCRDLWELNDDGTWTYSNAAAWAGLNASAQLAAQLGDTAAATRYHDAAARMHAAMAAELAPSGYFIRGIRNGRPDATVEAANLALGRYGFGAWADDDPLMLATGRMVESRLSSPGGGVRRYENDQYYNGQPWPVSTAWLGMHDLALGDRAGAQRLFDVMTRYAKTTDALMLGEQFNEQQHRWVSAFPLAWSEAAYIQFANALSAGSN
ncbi:MAG TPA: glycoside hydrolase family 15 protein, partial [Oscillatoriaceae cyanobacterium]